MSTNKTDALIEWAMRVAEASNDDGFMNLGLAAKAEMEALKRAAKFWVSRAGDLNIQEHEAHDDLMQSIAKDAP